MKNWAAPGIPSIYGTEKMREVVLGAPYYEQEKYSDAYDKHYAGVRNHFQGRDSLIEINIFEGEGWEKICPFLNKNIPGCDFPHVRHMRRDNGT